MEIKKNSKFESLRLLVTSRCPYKCFYCHREGMEASVPELLTLSDYEYFIGLLKKNFGLKDITLTGGDPFFRKDIGSIVKLIKKLNIFSIIVTKGMLIKKLVPVDQITFTIDTLNGELYSRITGVDSKFLKKTISKLIEAKSKKIRVVVNTPISRNINDSRDNFEDLLAFCKKNKVDEWKIIEEIDTKNGFASGNLYIEDYAKRMGIKGIPKIIKNYKFTIEHSGVLISLYRCHCNVVYITKKHIAESLFLDPAGNIILCMMNDKKINILDLIQKRDSNSINKIINNINFNKICPVLKLK